MTKVKAIPQPVADFLLANEFLEIDIEPKSYFNGKCIVSLNEGIQYRVYFKDMGDGESGSMFSSDLNIYWLIGVLTYYECIPKDWKPIPYRDA